MTTTNLIASQATPVVSSGQNDTQSALKFITCGSVDDGKSTLIGRLLIDSRSVLLDQLANVSKSGEADLALGLAPQLEAGFYQNVLFSQKFACMVSAHHPRIQKELRLEQFASERHAVVSSSGAAPLILDQALERLGIKRKISLNIPNFIGAALVVEHTDLILTIPERLADVLQGRAAVKTFPVPFQLPPYDVKQHWHERFHNDPGSQWLRRVIASLMAQGA